MMGTNSHKGFTLIEVILFLAIAGLMLLGVLVGVSGSINRQRYDESVASFLDYMQSQYNLNDNVRNNRPDARGCVAGSIVSSAPDQPRGTSDCTVVGRLVRSTDGEVVNSRPVFATSEAMADPSDEADLIDSLGLIVAPDDLTDDNADYEMLWQTQLYTDKTNPAANRDFAVLVLRLPTNGLTRTYVTENYTSLSDFWNASPQPDTVDLCVSTSGLTNAPANGVRILSRASASNGVQFIPASEDTC